MKRLCMTLLTLLLPVLFAISCGFECVANELILDSIPAYTGKANVSINKNQPYFTDKDLTTVAFETYSDLDDLGRCGVAYANICKELMPTEERGEIGIIKPSGWHTVKYPKVIPDLYLYNRCHLIGFQLAGENANPKNLITGTRYLNVTGMLPFENQVADYVHRTNNHVLYRVTPVFKGDNLVADGVLMEAKSVEDNGVCFNVFCYNVQPSIIIDYATGNSSWDGKIPESDAQGASVLTNSTQAEIAVFARTEAAYVLNTNTRRFHRSSCDSVKDIKDKNRKDVMCGKEQLLSEGYIGCKKCNP